MTATTTVVRFLSVIHSPVSVILTQSYPRILAFLCVALVLSTRSASAQVPELRYDTPAGFMGGGGKPPETWLSNNVDGMIDIYPFQAFNGDFRGQFSKTLFRERIKQQNRETRLLTQPAVEAVSVPGADAAMIVRFVADHSGYQRQHARLAVLAGGAVAIIDVSASSPEAFQRNWPGAQGLLRSLSIVKDDAQRAATAAAATQVPASAAHAKIAGLYVGSTMVFQANPFGGVGSGTWVPGTKWYLLAPDGKAHMGFRLPEAPGGDIRRFDFDAAKRAAPQYAGTYSVEGNKVTIRLGLETVIADLSPAGDLMIRGTPYRPSKLK